MALLAEILSSRVRAEIFRILFGLSPEEIHMREIERRSGLSIGTVNRELGNLERLDLIESRKDGNRTYYRANESHPLFPDIRNLVLKTAGLVDVLREALKHPAIRLAFVFGSVARGEEKSGSDVDLMVIGGLGLRELAVLLSGVPERIGRSVNPHVLSVEEFRKRIAEGEHLVTQILAAPKLFVIGSQDELTAVGQ